ncbi:dihydrofolate reductase [Arthrobacter sp. MYb211]|uniref:dihydrofolate reductase family protein n=1 Tax=Micrococcaceae TaxID=1268 RepID=UPI000BB8EA66|nr:MULTISPECIES: dihydrofolate reductase family protein [Micrococcaceae]PCC29176.1 deaminase [Glutamicibacter sp. BW80]PRA13783.1 dihydrofolate reductase [Arthrobacter sp. MYb221]PRC09153.1 dihydrofolate reductase [Arthrobacter sp. MYb211]
MTQIIFDAAVTLNGFLADENHSLQWLFDVPGAGEPDPGLLPQNVGVHVEGANTYLWVLEHENLLAEPAKWQKLYGDKPTYVFTHRQLPIPEGANVKLVSGSASEQLPELRRAAGEADIWVLGGGELLGQFLDIDALDRLALTIAPATVAGGAALLPRSIGSERLELAEARQAGPFARLVYRVKTLA